MRRIIYKGFTLIELLVVIAIVGILFTVGTTSYLTAQKQVRDSRRKTDLLEIQQALETFRSENGYYPDDASWESDLMPTYITSIPEDPKEGSYRYVGGGGAYNATYSLCATLENVSTTPDLNHCSGTENYEVESP